MSKPFLRVSNLTLLYPKSPALPLLNNISFEIAQGEILCVLGPNGSGKSTLLRTLLGGFAYRGEIIIQGANARDFSAKQRAKFLSYVPQNYHISFPYSALEVVLMGRFNHNRLLYSKSDKHKALKALAMLEIEHLAYSSYPTLSGGQKQLVLIARSLAQESEIILLDEMTSALDMSHSFALLKILKSIQKSIILTSHHPEQCYIADKIALLKDAQLLCYGGRENVLTESYIQKLYGIESLKVPLPNGGVYFCPKI
ncbi:ABC transporter ATP-binding protein [Helicobacter sp. MIT 21-1697]|uniref:ABC transporter ATP-binding protein n=1 Tax=Helicobacter sp. MIT 21-1697 TaxID=2993733 RepID=UPI00224B289F|nr:ABC transporter ATP-binding protein [Helicobacter sp. MIT 21-1697]MCX2716802.1 ABC transporter ATP-binding protein [Helicobacter sp. MIT 21-1697]